MTTRIVYMGTPDFAVPALSALIDNSHNVVGVVTQPDRRSGRGKKITPPPVKVVAEAAGLPVLQPESLKNEADQQALFDLAPDLIVVAAFGQILKKEVLDFPQHGCINIHASLLPRWRGAAPISAAIRAGDGETGVTLMQMDVGLDTGPMIVHRAIPITAQHTTGNLTEELASLGANLLIGTLPAWLAGEITPTPQDNELATLAPRLKKEEGRIDWTEEAVAIERQVRAFSPWPGTFTNGPRGQIKVHEVRLAPEVKASNNQHPGTLFKQQRKIYVNTGSGVLQLVTVQPAGKKTMPVEAVVNGQPEIVGSRLGQAN